MYVIIYLILYLVIYLNIFSIFFKFVGDLFALNTLFKELAFVY